VNGDRSHICIFDQIKNTWVKGYLASNKNEGWHNFALPAFSNLFYRLLTFVLHSELEALGNTQVYQCLPDVNTPLRSSIDNS
jgi:hypothetical protein